VGAKTIAPAGEAVGVGEAVATVVGVGVGVGAPAVGVGVATAVAVGVAVGPVGAAVGEADGFGVGVWPLKFVGLNGFAAPLQPAIATDVMAVRANVRKRSAFHGVGFCTSNPSKGKR